MEGGGRGADVRGRVGGRGAVVGGRVGREIEFPEWRRDDSAAIFCSFSDSVFTIVDSRDTSPSRERNLALNWPICWRPHRGSSCSRWLHCGGRGRRYWPMG